MPDVRANPARLAPAAPSGRQTIVALCALGSLALIATGILMVQSRFNPAVLNFLESATTAPPPVARTPAAGELLLPMPANMSALTPPESFDPGTLSDKIDGKAELYLSAGFVRLQCQRVALVGQPDLWVEVFIYDMGSPPNAFAVFSTQRRADAAPLDVGGLSYRAGNALFIAHGPYYLELIASSSENRLIAALTELAEGFVRLRPVAAGPIGERDLFPKNGLSEASITLIPADAFGVSDLNQVFTATYRRGATEMTAFLSRRVTPQAAADRVRSYAEFLTSYGGTIAARDEPVPGAVVIAIMDAYEVAFHQGPFFAGVHEASDKEQAVALARELDAKLKEVPNARP
jgi:hypothetical protein